MDALNGVKLDLGLAILLCVTAALVLAVLPLSRWLEFVLLVVFAAAAAGWVVLRTRRVLQRLAASRETGGEDGAQQE